MKPNYPLFLLFFLLTQSVFAQPVINSFSPSSAKYGDTVIISGSNFSAVTSNNIVFFGAVKAQVITASLTSVSVKVPAGATYEAINITVNGLTGYSRLPFILSFGDGNPGFPSDNFADPVFGTVPASDMSIADLDADGKADLVVSEPAVMNAPPSSNNNFYIIKNTSTPGTISYAPKMTFTLGDHMLCSKVLTGDMDGDGKTDVVALWKSQAKFSIFKNTSSTGTITLDPKTDVGIAAAADWAVITDVDGDGKNDVAVFNAALTIYRNISSGGSFSFTETATAITGDPGKFAMADINGDGSQDIIFISGNNIYVIKNTSTAGNISFASAVGFATGDNPLSFSTGDIDNDGKIDLACNNSTNSGSISILRNTSAGGNINFATKVEIPTSNGQFEKAISISDFDGDGKVDLVTDNSNFGGDFALYRNTSGPGSIAFAPKIKFNLSNIFMAPFGFIGSDQDNDGKTDLGILFSGDGGTKGYQFLRNTTSEPLINSFSPTAGGAGTLVTITGRNFNTASSVKIGGMPVSSFNIVSATVITAVVPTGSYGDIEVTTTFGVAKIAAFNLPAIQSFSPLYATVGTMVTIRGYNFSGITSISFGGISPYSFNILSDTVATAFIVSAASGSVAVTNAFGTVSKTGFQFGNPIVQQLCPPFGTATIETNVFVSNGNYQWQVFEDSAFVNITDNQYFSGTTTRFLTLTNVPSSWYGRMFRCLNGAVSIIKFSNSWNGTANNDWANPSNWSCAAVPDNNTDVRINSGTVVINSNVTIRSLSVGPGVVLTVNPGFVLTILH